MAVKERLGSDHKARSAESALRAIVIHEGLLHRMQFAILHQRLNRDDGLALRLNGQHGAGIDGLVVEQHGAGSTLAAVANPFRSGDIEVVAERVEQSYTRLDQNVMRLAVDGQCDGSLSR